MKPAATFSELLRRSRAVETGHARSTACCTRHSSTVLPFRTKKIGNMRMLGVIMPSSA